MLTEKTQNQILDLQKEYPEKRSALLPALHLAQDEVGYLPLEVQQEVANLFGINVNEVHSVVSFYDMFYDKPVGKHVIHVCKNLSCMLRGSDELMNKLCHHLQVCPHEVTADGEFTIVPSECLAACDRAPMMIVDEEVVGPVSLDEVEKLISKIKDNHKKSS